MSLRPGIGFTAMEEVARTIERFNLVDRMSDVPTSLRHGRRLLPLGRYLRRRLRVLLGRDPKISQEALDELAQEMLDVRLAARASEENPSIKSHILAKNKGKVAGITARSKINRKRVSI